MRYSILAAAVLSLILSIPSLSIAQNTIGARLITVSGTAEIKVIPDEVDIQLGVETRDKNLSIAKAQNDESIKKVLAFASNYGIDPKYLQTDYLSVEPIYTDNGRILDFYVVHKRIAIILKDISKFEGLLTGVLEAGANHVQNIQFRTTELRKYRDQARVQAIKAAREKATTLAKELGQNVGKAHTIYEDSYGWTSSYSQNVSQNAGGVSATNEGSISLGQISVTARVTVSFELE